jgi:hypothetical protein
MCIGVHVQYCYSYQILNKPEYSKNLISNFVQIHAVGGELFQAGGQTDKMLLIFTCHYFVNVLNKVHMVLLVRSHLNCCSHSVLCKLYESCSDGACCCPTGAYDLSAVDHKQCSRICM